MAEDESTTSDVNVEKKPSGEEIDSSRTNSLLEFKQLEQEVQNSISDTSAPAAELAAAAHDADAVGGVGETDDKLTINPAESTDAETTTGSTEQEIETVREVKPAAVLLAQNEDSASTKALVGSPPPHQSRQEAGEEKFLPRADVDEEHLVAAPPSEALYGNDNEKASPPDIAHKGEDSDTIHSSPSVDVAENDKMPQAPHLDSNATTVSASDTAEADNSTSLHGEKDGAGDTNRQQTPIGPEASRNENNEECKCEVIRKDPKTKTKVCSIL